MPTPDDVAAILEQIDTLEHATVRLTTLTNQDLTHPAIRAALARLGTRPHMLHVLLIARVAYHRDRAAKLLPSQTEGLPTAG